MASDPDVAQPLEFDTAVPADRAEGTCGAQDGIRCANCQQLETDQYYDVNGSPLCDRCRAAVTTLTETPKGVSVLIRAALLGVVAAVLGAVLYYAVIAITDFEIGLVAIAIGYMVGYAIRTGAGGRGGRRFQVLAVVLTYWAVGLAYSPLFFKQIDSASQTTAPAANGSAAPPVVQAEAAAGETSFMLAVGALLGLTLALPVLAVIGSLPGGLISAAIIAFGMHQAWRMTGAPRIEVTGPYRIGAVRSAPA
jgi:hypothetical protein